MNDQEYQNMYENEESHFFYQTTHNIVLALAKKFLNPATKNRILDVGCGTGQLVKKLALLGDTQGVDSHPNAIALGKKKRHHYQKREYN